ncbi:MAG: hypothetical protein ABII76_08750, partial [Pseudomonadota bacterium]
DSIGQPKISLESRQYTSAYISDFHLTRWVANSVGPAILQANKDQRLWFLMQRLADATAPPYYVEHEMGMAIGLDATARYEIARGAR